MQMMSQNKTIRAAAHAARQIPSLKVRSQQGISAFLRPLHPFLHYTLSNATCPALEFQRMRILSHPHPPGAPHGTPDTNHVNDTDARVRGDKLSDSRFHQRRLLYEYACAYAPPAPISVSSPNLPLHAHPGLILIRRGTCNVWDESWRWQEVGLVP